MISCDFHKHDGKLVIKKNLQNSEDLERYQAEL